MILVSAILGSISQFDERYAHGQAAALHRRAAELSSTGIVHFHSSPWLGSIARCVHKADHSLVPRADLASDQSGKDAMQVHTAEQGLQRSPSKHQQSVRLGCHSRRHQ